MQGAIAIRLSAALVATALLCSCGGKLDELFGNDEILDLQVQPNPVPAPAVGSFSTFSITVRVKSKQDFRSIFFEASNSANLNARQYLADVGVCGSSSQSCGDSQQTISCTSSTSAAEPNVRRISCNSSSTPLATSPGSTSWRTYITRYEPLFGTSEVEDDSRIFSVAIQ